MGANGNAYRCSTLVVGALAALLPAGAPGFQESVRAQVPWKVIALKPMVRFDDVRGPALGVGGGNETQYQQLLLAAARDAVGPKTPVIEIGELDPSVAMACGKLDALVSRMARGSLNDEAISDLTQLAAFDDAYAVLVQFLHVKTGPGQSWNAMTGAITSSAASTLIQSALIAGKTGRVIWKGERLVRGKALGASSPELSKSLRLVYKDFSIE